MRGYFIEHEGKIYQATKPETLRILRGIARGETPGTDGLKEVGPITFSLTKVDRERARDLFTDINLA